MVEPEAVAALRTALGATATSRGAPFGIYIDDTGARALLAHYSELETRIANLTAQLALARRTELEG